MRLTVHVKEGKQSKEEKKVKDGVKIVTKTMNTLAFNNVKPSEVSKILQTLEDDGYGTPTKHYLSNEKIPGHASGKKKKI